MSQYATFDRGYGLSEARCGRKPAVAAQSEGAEMTDSPVYYRLYNHEERGPVVICLQWFDEYDYDHNRYVGDPFDDEAEAEAALVSLKGLEASTLERIGFLCIQGHPNRICPGCTSACREPVFAYPKRGEER